MLDYQQGEITLVKYIARTSLAAQLSVPYINQSIVERLPSKFQKEMMNVDMDKTLLIKIQRADFDVLLLDFIDERFSIGVIDGARFTLSREFLDANRKELSYPEWNRFSVEKYTAWQRGFAELVALVKQKTRSPKMVINKVYFSALSGTSCVDFSKCASFMDSEIKRNNDYLDKLYAHVATTYPEIDFIEVPDKLLIANPKHKWGLAPFHYIDELYLFVLQKLKTLYGVCKQ